MPCRVVDLISRLAPACHAAATPPAAAQLAAAALVESFPGAAAVVFEHAAGDDTLHAIAGACIPAAWRTRPLPLASVPLLARALRAPGALARGSTSGRRHAICGVVPHAADPAWVLVLVTPRQPLEEAILATAVEAVRHLLAAAAPGAELARLHLALRAEVERRRASERGWQKSHAELEALTTLRMNALEAERKRIAQDLHDAVGQSLSAIKYSLEHAQELTRRQQPAVAAEVIRSTIECVRRAIDDVRGITTQLRPPQLDDLGAASAVRWLCREWQNLYEQIALDAEIAAVDAQIPPMLGINVYRAVQESLNNIAQHAGTHRVKVAMRIDDGTLRLTVSDDGSDGLRPQPDGGTTEGLAGLRERAERSGGRCDVASAPGQGTTVRMEWPVAAGRAAMEANACVN